MQAYENLKNEGIHCAVVDMPSYDGEMLADCAAEGKPLIVVEQNNGHVWQNMLKDFANRGLSINTEKFHAVNTLNGSSKPQFIHSGTYTQLTKKHELDAQEIARRTIKIRYKE